MSRVPVWVPEQLVLFALLANATYWQVEKRLGGWAALTLRDASLLVLSGALVMASQKVRSMADRQRETNEAEGVADAPMSCSPKVALWSLVSQALGLAVGIAAAPTRAHALVALFVAGYVPVWRRRVYRRWVKPFEPRTIGQEEAAALLRGPVAELGRLASRNGVGDAAERATHEALGG